MAPRKAISFEVTALKFASETWSENALEITG
jgi:hypothetical protein